MKVGLGKGVMFRKAKGYQETEKAKREVWSDSPSDSQRDPARLTSWPVP